MSIGANHNVNDCVKKSVVCLLIVQNSANSLMLRYSRIRNTNPYITSTAVAMAEIVKFVVCIWLMMMSDAKFSVGQFAHSIHNMYTKNAMDTLKIIVPAFTFTFQNNLLYIAISYLDAATFQAASQLKLLTTAIFMKFLLRKKFGVQWFALILLFFGVTIIQTQSSKETNKKIGINSFQLKNQTLNEMFQQQINIHINNNDTRFINMTMARRFRRAHEEKLDEVKMSKQKMKNVSYGSAAVILSCILSGFSSVYFEKLLKHSVQSIWERNFQLSFFSIIFSFIAIFLNNRKDVEIKGFFIGYDYLVIIIILIQSAGGLLVAATIKYADNIIKSYSVSISIIIVTIFSAIFMPNDSIVTLAFYFGTFIVIISTLLYNKPDYIRTILFCSNPSDHQIPK
ncbi:hypothetical protein SNEBB_004377 [Seison nebaliae]|nr:hypothetical protein SNEBB_004377 [Seison nebaliae]